MLLLRFIYRRNRDYTLQAADRPCQCWPPTTQMANAIEVASAVPSALRAASSALVRGFHRPPGSLARWAGDYLVASGHRNQIHVQTVCIEPGAIRRHQPSGSKQVVQRSRHTRQLIKLTWHCTTAGGAVSDARTSYSSYRLQGLQSDVAGLCRFVIEQSKASTFLIDEFNGERNPTVDFRTARSSACFWQRMREPSTLAPGARVSRWYPF